jgi:hypothetical protein
VEPATEEPVAEEAVPDHAVKQADASATKEHVSPVADGSRVEELPATPDVRPRPRPAPVVELAPVSGTGTAPSRARPQDRQPARSAPARERVALLPLLRTVRLRRKAAVSQPPPPPQPEPEPQQPPLQPLPRDRVQSHPQPVAAESPREERVEYVEQRLEVERPARVLPPLGPPTEARETPPRRPPRPQPGPTGVEIQRVPALPEAPPNLPRRGRDRERAEPQRWVEDERALAPPPETAPGPAPVPDRQTRAESVYWSRDPVADRWPTLLDPEPPATDDWEVNLRTWQRLQRLDREQRGHVWNESPF